MKVITLLLALSTILHAATPTMWVKDNSGRIPLKIDTIHARINLIEDLAETTLTLRFRNETTRMQEGEFVLPLPRGATVSSYALEVQGKLRDGVAVEKQQARNAYETIKRQMIDPGLVEREANNTYRTKVFPIPAKGTKLIRISYIEKLPIVDKQLRYKLPTDYPSAIDSFECTVNYHGKDKPSIQSESLTFQPALSGQLKASCQKQLIKGNIAISYSPSRGHVLLSEQDPSNQDQQYVYLSYSPPKGLVDQPRPQPKHINIIWDASDSRRNQQHDAEFKLLDAYFRQFTPGSSTKVTLQLLRHRLINHGEFTVKSGDWSTLRQQLKQTFYDGSTGVKELHQSQHKADLTLFFSDLHSKEQAQLVQLNPQQNTFLFHRGENRWFTRHTHKTFGAAIHLDQSSSDQALKHLTHTSFRIESVDAPGAHLIPCHNSNSNKHSLVGTFTELPKEAIVITYHNANGKTIKQKISTTVVQPNNSDNIIQRLWAQEQLIQLERDDHRERIISHCRRHGLVSDYTSLIVLERFEDYVRFDIPPPEPELRKQWQAQRRQQTIPSISKENLAVKIRQAWQSRLSWHLRKFSWRSKTLHSKIVQANIWLDATKKLFHQEDLDQQAYGVIENWYQQTQKLIKNESSIRNQISHDRWINEQNKLVKQWASLTTLKVKRAPDQRLAISVRGLVNQPNTYRSDQPLTLQQAIALAGGTHPAGSLQSVSLYRNAHATTYNLLSSRYQDIPLVPGDMIVAEPAPYDDYSDDPFGGGESSETSDPSEAPAIAEHRPQITSDDIYGSTDGGGRLGEGDPFGGHRKKSGNTEGKIRILPPLAKDCPSEQFVAFEKDLQNGVAPLTAYQKLKNNSARPPHFYLTAARILAHSKHHILALQTLSNIIENQPDTIATQRSWAYLLGEIGQFDLALNTLQSLSQSHPDDLHTRLDIIRYRQKNQPKQSVSKIVTDYNAVIDRAQGSWSDLNFVTLALTERNAHLTTSSSPSADSHSENLSSDIRIVVYSSNPQARIHLNVKEPIDDWTSKWHTSLQGGRIFKAGNIHDYMLRRAMPGNYSLSCTSYSQTTLQIVIYTHWGTEQQQCKWTTVYLNEKSYNVPIAECELKFKEVLTRPNP